MTPPRANNEVDELAETSRDKVTRSKMTKSDLEKEFERDRKKKNKVTFENQKKEEDGEGSEKD